MEMFSSQAFALAILRNNHAYSFTFVHEAKRLTFMKLECLLILNDYRAILNYIL